MKKSKVLRAAVYTRFSTDKQSSTAAQLTVCRGICKREGFKVTAEFADEAISGGTTRRPGYQAMLAAARAKELDVIVAEDSSRLWRGMAEQAPRIAELEDLGVHVVCHDFDTRNESAGILGAVTGAMSEQYLKEIGRRTKRSLAERATDGRLTGGRAFGYTVKGEERAIEPKEAKVVRQIFEWRADGWSALRIARHLNEKGVPAPGAHWNRKNGQRAVWRTSAIAGDWKRGIGILNNELYRGHVIYNRFEWVRGKADRSKRKPKLRPRSEWTIHERPKLRIVPEGLWLAVAKMQTADGPKKQAIKAGMKRTLWTGRPRWWLSGILACAACKSNLQISGLDYICPMAFVRKCSNNVRVRKADIEAEMLARLRADLLDPAVIQKEIKRVAKDLKLLEAEEAVAARAAVDGTAMRRVEREMRDVSKLRIGAAAKEAALAALRAERDALEATAKGGTPGSGLARRVLGRLPEFAKEFDHLIGKALGKAASPSAIDDARAATADLIEGGKVFVKAGKEATEARIKLLGLGGSVLRIAKARRIGSGGRI